MSKLNLRVQLSLFFFVKQKQVHLHKWEHIDCQHLLYIKHVVYSISVSHTVLKLYFSSFLQNKCFWQTQMDQVVSVSHTVLKLYFFSFLQNKCFWQTQMDQVVQKVLDQTGFQGTGGSASKPCRYGSSCSRPGCRFKHPGRIGGNCYFRDFTVL
jgi:hypothetical protein